MIAVRVPPSGRIALALAGAAAFVAVGLARRSTATSTTTGSTAGSRRRATRRSSPPAGTAVATSTWRARRSAAAASRSTSTSRPATPRIRRRRYPVLYLLHGVPGPARRVPRRPCAWASSRTSSSRSHRARPMILVMPFGSTGIVHRQGVGERHPAARGLGDVRRPRRRPRDRRALPDDPQRCGRGARRPLRGRLRRAQHRRSTTRGEFGVLESWSGYERADDIALDLRAPSRAASLQQPARDARAGRAGAPPRAHVLLVLHAAPATASCAQNDALRAAARARRHPAPLRLVRGGHDWALWRGQCRARATSRPRGISACVA